MKLRRLAARATALTATAVVVATGFTTTAWAGNATVTSGALVLNNGSHPLTVSGPGTYLPSVTFKLVRHGSTASQDTLTASASGTPGASGSTASGSVNYTNANPGAYDVEVHNGPTTASPVVDSCSSCVTVIGFKPVVTSVSPATLGEGTIGGGYQNFVITGQNFTKGLYTQCTTLPCAGNGPWVRVLRSTGEPDPNVVLTQTVNPSNGTSAPTAPTPTTITLRVDVTGTDTAAYQDNVEVINTDLPNGKAGSCTACLTIVPAPTVSSSTLVPKDFPLSTLSPSSQLGQNAQNQTIVLVGTHFPSDASIFFEKPAGTSSSDTSTITVGHVAFADNGAEPDTLTLTGVNADVTATGTWLIHVMDFDNHAASAGTPLLVNPAPSGTGMTYVDDSPATTRAYGQGAQAVRVDVSGPHGTFVTGSGVAPDSTPHTIVNFSGPTGVTYSSQVTTAGAGSNDDNVRTTFSLPESAATGDYDVIVVNPDGGTGVCSSSSFPLLDDCFLTVSAGPKVTSASPSTVAPAFSGSVTVKGSGFHSGTNNLHVRIGPADAPFFDGNATRTDANTVTVSGVNVPGGTTPADYDVVVTNNDDRGTGTGAGAFHVTNLTVSGISPVGESNDPGSSPVNTTISGNNFATNGAVVKLVKDGVPDITGSPTSSTTDTTTSLFRTFDLSNVAPGAYDVVVTNPGNGANAGTGSCVGCFTVLANAPSMTDITPNALGAGATAVTVTVTGSNIFDGATLVFSNAKVHPIGSLAPADTAGKYTQQVSVDADATPGAGTVKVRNTDGQESGTQPFTVDAPPTISSIDPDHAAEGSTFSLTVNGGNFQNGATLDFSAAGVTAANVVVTTTKITADVTVGPNVAPGGSPRAVHVMVDNPDHGQATSPTDLTITQAPTINHLDPARAPVGKKFTVHVIGDHFASDATLTSADHKIALSNVTVVSDHEIDATANTTGTPVGKHGLTVSNQDGGVATAKLAVFTKPAKPSHLRVLSRDRALLVTWGTPASNGGDPVSSYTATVTKHGGGAGTSYTTSSPSQRSHRFSGLVNGRLYDVKVVATNSAGNGPRAAGSGRPTYPTALTEKRSATSVHQGHAVTLSGRLSRSTGAGLVGARIAVVRIVNGHRHLLGTVRTHAGGKWHLTFTPTKTALYRASFHGDTADRASSSKAHRVRVRS